MPLIGIVARKKDIKDIKRKLGENYELIELNSESIKNLKNIKFGKISLSSYGKDWYFSVLKEITKNKKGEICWFYYSNDYKNRPVINFLIQYLKSNTEILEELKTDNSYLFKVRI